jgi:hypothetical protein
MEPLQKTGARIKHKTSHGRYVLHFINKRITKIMGCKKNRGEGRKSGKDTKSTV